jgi:hypothetical protein
MFKFDNGVEEEMELMVNADAEWEKDEGALDRKYRILWKKPKHVESTPDLYQETQQREQDKPGVGGEMPWDQLPGKAKRNGGW